MKLPNAKKALIDLRKLNEYALDFDSPRGMHKARVFKSVLGFTSDSANELKTAIFEAVQNAEATLAELDFYGQRYTVDCRIRNKTGEATVKTCWFIRRSEDFPRLTTCYVLKERK